MSNLLTVQQAADQLNVSTDLVYDLVRDGVLTGRRISPRRIRLLQSDLDDYVARVKILPPPKMTRPRKSPMPSSAGFPLLAKYGPKA